MRAVGIIPARLQSSRLPRKLLLAETGKPLIQHTWEAACRCTSLDEVLVATDSVQIAEAVAAFGGSSLLTGEHSSGTDRIAEVVRKGGLGSGFRGQGSGVRGQGSEVRDQGAGAWDSGFGTFVDTDVIVNIQGDEPEIDSEDLNRLVETMRNHPGSEMATLATPITRMSELTDPSCTKVVCADDGRALYFSREPIPHCRDQRPEDLLEADSPWLLHLGIYAYRRDFLLKLSQMGPSRLERLEKLEQLRALEIGACIQVAIVETRSVGIDTPDDYARFVARQQRAAA